LDGDADAAPDLTLTRFRLRLEEEHRGLFAAQHAPVDRPLAAARLLWPLAFAGEPREVCAALFFDARHRPIGYQVAFSGTLHRAAVEPRQVLAAALLANAAGFLLAHNHPSGDPSPSSEDVRFTRRLEAAADVLGLHLLDHLILASDRGVLRLHSLMRRAGW
jgi:DNA repair protein RadC